nr:hypothetical protein [Wadden Sea poxvirus]
MFVENKSLILYSKWIKSFILLNDKFIQFPNNDNNIMIYKYSENFKIIDKIKSVILLNPSLINLLKICVYLKHNNITIPIVLLLKKEIFAPPFRINDN